MTAQLVCTPYKESQAGMGEVKIAVIKQENESIRTIQEDEAFDALCISIREHGVIEPVVLREDADGLRLVAGARRLAACKKLGFETIPAHVLKGCDACEALLVSLCENLHRRSLHYLDEAAVYRRAIEEFGLTQEALSRRIGQSQSAIANKLRLLQLRESEQEALRSAGLSQRHARALLALEEETDRLKMIALCASQEITVKHLERMIAQELAKKQATASKRILLVMHDQRLYINAIRDIVTQMKASGIRADLSMEDLGDRIEMRVIMPRRSCRT